MTSYNIPGLDGAPLAVSAVTGVIDQGTVACIARALADDRFVKLPSADDPEAANARAMEAVRSLSSTVAPAPFIAAMIMQESGGRHFRVPRGNDRDNFVVVGLDRGNKDAPEQITSRGYGIGQYTIFHHPPRPEEVADFILDPVRNVQKAFHELREKFDKFVVGPSSKADDRVAEHPAPSPRPCKHAASDPRYMTDCNACAAAARRIDIRRGTPAYPGAPFGYEPGQYYPSADYPGVPDRTDFACDWPYAARRYNGGGNDSFHYQTRVLLNLRAAARRPES